MKEIFDIKRFFRYIVSDVRSCMADYGLSMLLISLMGVIIYAGTVIMGLIFNGSWEGPEISFRAMVFCISMFVLFVTMPVKCYGKITDKRSGSDFILTPASSFEKFLSMVIMSIFVIPLATATVYLSLDAILCAVDSTCGKSVFESLSALMNDFVISNMIDDGEMENLPLMADFLKQVTNPWLYVDDLIGLMLVLLLGAIFFKRSKTVKTFLAFMLVTFIAGMALIPVTQAIFGDIVFIKEPLSGEDVDDIFNMGIFRHAALIDTINDTVVNLLLLGGIYLRIKTLKH